jgi:hypothetical protein
VGDLPVSLVPKKGGGGARWPWERILLGVGVTTNPHRHNAFYTVFQRTLADGRRGEAETECAAVYDIYHTYTHPYNYKLLRSAVGAISQTDREMAEPSLRNLDGGCKSQESAEKNK